MLKLNYMKFNVLTMLICSWLFSCNSKGQKDDNSQLSQNLLINKEWILVTEEDPVTGINDVPESYYVSRHFFGDGSGVHNISSNMPVSRPDASNFNYTIKENRLTITNEDGYEINEKILEVNDEKLVVLNTKFDSKKTYNANTKSKSLLDSNGPSDLSLDNIDTKSDRYIDISTSPNKINYYGLQRNSIIDDNGVTVSFSLPIDWKETDHNKPELTRYMKFNDNGSLSTFYIKWFESYNTSRLSDKQFADIIIDGWDSKVNKVDYIKSLLPKNIFENLQFVKLRPNLIINSKHFLQRVVYYVDARDKGSALEGLITTEFHYVSYHKGRKYEVFISHIGNDEGYGSLLSLFNSIAGTIEFK